MTKTHVVVDGSNLATEGRLLPSLAQLDEAVTEYLTEYPDSEVTVVVDATFGHRIEEEELSAFEEARANREIVSPPAGAIGRGDAFVLKIAEKLGAMVLSNDSFQEFHAEYAWLFEKERLMGGMPVPGAGWIWTYRTPVRGPKSREVTRQAKAATKRATKAKSKSEGSASGVKAKKVAKDTVAAEVPMLPGDDLVAKGRAALASLPDAKSKSKSKTKGRGKATDGETSAVDTPPDVGAAGSDPTVAPASEEEGSGGKRRRRRRSSAPSAPSNEPGPFLSFVSSCSPGDVVEGEVQAFASHGAWITVDGARCYIPLSLMSDPPPRAARDVLSVGKTRQFVVVAFDAPRRGIELGLPGVVSVHSVESLDFGDAEENEGKEPASEKELELHATLGATKQPVDPAEARRKARSVAAKKAAATRAAKRAAAKQPATPSSPEDTAQQEPVTGVVGADSTPDLERAAKRAAAAKKAAATRAAKRAAAQAAAGSESTIGASSSAIADTVPAKPALVKKTATKQPTTKKASVTKTPVRKVAASEEKKAVTPAKKSSSFKKVAAKVAGSVKKATGSAKKAVTPTKKAATPTKKAATPTKKAATPARKAATPAKKVAAKVAIPAKETTASAKKAATPVKKATASARKAAVPSKKATSAPVTKATASAKKAATASKKVATKAAIPVKKAPASAKKADGKRPTA